MTWTVAEIVNQHNAINQHSSIPHKSYSSLITKKFFYRMSLLLGCIHGVHVHIKGNSKYNNQLVLSNENSVNFAMINFYRCRPRKIFDNDTFAEASGYFRRRKDWVLIRHRANFCWWKQHQVVNFHVVRICGRFMAWSSFLPAVDL